MESVNDTALKIEPLSTKKAVEFLLDGTLKTKVCKYCLNISYPLFELDQFMQIAGEGQETIYKVTIRHMISCFHPFQANNDHNLPNKICNKCLNRTISSYLFTQQCERAQRAILNCFNDIDEKFDKLDSLDRPKKRGRQKLNPNYNIIYTEHKRVIDYAEPIINLVNSGSEYINNIEEPRMDILECPKCWQVLPNMESLLNHAKLHPKSMWSHCRICGKSFAKRNQLKKHIHYSHTLGKDLSLQNTEITNFTCNNCGVTSDNYIEHLQHIEKHKFKMALKHIVDKKTDELCTICLNKSLKLTDLEKSICIHGGCPELTGNRTLYNIMASTIPDRKTYKYQELHIPYKACIMRIIKKNKNLDSNLNNKENSRTAISTDINLNLNFIFSSPDIISEDMIDSDNIYLFEFSNPNNPEESEPENYGSFTFESTTDSEISGNNKINDNNTCVVSMKIDKETKVNRAANTVSEIVSSELTASKDLVKEDLSAIKTLNDDYKTSLKCVKTQACKVCWVFNKPTCADCTKIENVKDMNKKKELSPIVDNSITSCKYCWIFEKSKEYHYCSKCNKKDKYEKPIPINSDENIEKNYTRKRKIVLNEEEQNVKKCAWQCNVCLTNNDTIREMCICCNSLRNINETITKVNVGLNMNNIFRLEAARVETVSNISTSQVSSTPVHETTNIDLNIDNIEENNINKERKILCEMKALNVTIPPERKKILADEMEIEIIPEHDNKFTRGYNNSKEVVEEEMIIEEENMLQDIVTSPSNPVSMYTNILNAPISSQQRNITCQSMQTATFRFTIDSGENKVKFVNIPNAPTPSQQENFTCQNMQLVSFQFTIGSGENKTKTVKRCKKRSKRYIS